MRLTNLDQKKKRTISLLREVGSVQPKFVARKKGPRHQKKRKK
jgi:hypothetical protein